LGDVKKMSGKSPYFSLRSGEQISLLVARHKSRT